MPGSDLSATIPRRTVLIIGSDVLETLLVHAIGDQRLDLLNRLHKLLLVQAEFLGPRAVGLGTCNTHKSDRAAIV